MVSEEIIQAEKEYLVNVLGKQLTDSEERDDRTCTTFGNKRVRGYTIIAMKYWPNEFLDGKKKHIHHINFDRSDNRACNLVVLNAKEHKLMHKLFDPDYEEQCKRSAKARIGLPGPWSGKHQSIESNNKRSKTLKGRTSPMKNRNHSEKSKALMRLNLKGKNKGKHRVYNPDGTYHMEY